MSLETDFAAGMPAGSAEGHMTGGVAGHMADGVAGHLAVGASDGMEGARTGDIANDASQAKGALAMDASLMGFIEQVSGEVQLRVEESLGDGYVRLRIAEAERRQAKHDIRCVEDIVIELLRNARDAGAKAVFVATTKDQEARFITIVDDGAGIPEAMHSLVFEPRVTSKLDSMVMDDWGVHGRGMALFSIKCNVEDVRIGQSGPGLGTSITARINTDALPERADQSTAPVLEKDEDGTLRVTRGPHNMLRHATEFALAHKPDVSVYFGSPSEIIAALMELGQHRQDRSSYLFRQNMGGLPLPQRIAACVDALELVEVSRSIGLGISERTAHRVLNGQIRPVRPLLESPQAQRAESPKGVDLTKDPRGLKLSEPDMMSFSRAMERAFEPLARQYYLSLTDMPKIRVKGDCITVRFLIEKEL
jgi:hypothetical protein